MVDLDFENLIVELKHINLLMSQLVYFVKIFLLISIICFIIHSISKIVNTFTLCDIKDSLDEAKRLSNYRNNLLGRIGDLLFTHNRLYGIDLKKREVNLEEDDE